MVYLNIRRNKFLEISKRSIDIVLSLFLIILFLPLIVIIAIAIKIDSKGPVLADTPQRVGKQGKHFKMYKFRSMVENAHEILREDQRYKDLLKDYKKGSYK